MRYGLLFILPLLAILIVTGVIIWRFLKNKRKIINKAIIAHTSPLKSLPEYKKARIWYRVLIGVAALVFLVSYICATVVASRPVDVTQEDTQYETRDIMLCLDVSGSMYPYLRGIFAYFSDITNKLKGQRIGLTIFDANSVMVFPLTDDYVAIEENINDINAHYNEYSVVARRYGSSSLIGNGLISCVNNFDKLGEEDRTRTVILATDNLQYVFNNESATLTQAAEYAKRYNIRIYGIDTLGEIDDLTTEFRSVAINSGGTYYQVGLSRNHDTSDISDRIMKQDAQRYSGAGRIVRTDSPNTAIIILCLSSIILLIIIWRLKV